MPTSLERVPKEPVLIATLAGKVTLDEILAIYRESAGLLADIPESTHKYRITDTRTLELTFSEMVLMLAEARKQVGLTTTNPNITVIFVGENEWITMSRNALKQPQYGGVDIKAVDSFDEAWTLIRADQARRKSQ